MDVMLLLPGPVRTRLGRGRPQLARPRRRRYGRREEAPVDEASERSFERFVAAEGTALLRFAYMLTGGRDTAEDLLQTALERCYRHWRRVERAGRPGRVRPAGGPPTRPRPPAPAPPRPGGPPPPPRAAGR